MEASVLHRQQVVDDRKDGVQDPNFRREGLKNGVEKYDGFLDESGAVQESVEEPPAVEDGEDTGTRHPVPSLDNSPDRPLVPSLPGRGGSRSYGGGVSHLDSAVDSILWMSSRTVAGSFRTGTRRTRSVTGARTRKRTSHRVRRTWNRSGGPRRPTSTGSAVRRQTSARWRKRYRRSRETLVSYSSPESGG